jgi:hypothetical protein
MEMRAEIATPREVGGIEGRVWKVAQRGAIQMRLGKAEGDGVPSEDSKRITDRVDLRVVLDYVIASTRCMQTT